MEELTTSGQEVDPRFVSTHEFSDESPAESSQKGSQVVQPLTPEALAAFNAAQERTGVVYISRIPPAMRPTKVRHLLSQHGEIGRVYLQQEGTCPHSR